MWDKLEKLFSAEDFTRRSQCGAWTRELALVSQLSDLMVAFAYFSIPVSLGMLWWHRRDKIARSWVILLFVAFISLCGLTHVCQALAFTYPAYRAFVLLTLITGLVSLTTAFVLPVVVAEVVKSPSVEALAQKFGTEALNKLEIEKGVERELRLRAETDLAAERARAAGLDRALREAQAGLESQRRVHIEAAQSATDKIEPSQSGVLRRGSPPGG